jgi:hypothetical protein
MPRNPRALAAAGFAALAVAAALAAGQGGPAHEREREGEDGRARRARAAGPQAVDPAAVAAAPGPSAAGTGFDSERLWSAFDDWEPALAADASSTWVYQMTTRYNGPAPCNGCSAPWIAVRRSSDSGATWQPDQLLTPYKKTHNDPQVEVALDGTLYAAWLHEYVPGVKFVKSTDRGATWSAPIALSAGRGRPSWSDKPILAISATGRDVYIAFNASDAYVSVSHDFGASFSRPIKTNADARYWFHGGGAVAPDGSVYFSSTDYSQDYSGDAHVSLVRSTDLGATWTTTRVDSSRQAPGCAWSPGCYLGFFGPQAALAADAAGRVMIAYNVGDAPGGPQRLHARSSTDGGATWSARIEIGSGLPGVSAGFPSLAAGPAAGDFRVGFIDDRNGSTSAFNAWYRRTIDGGASWTAAVRLSDAPAGAAYKTSAGFAFPYGDYGEIAVDAAGTAHVIWGEGAGYNGPGGTWYTRGR